MVDFGERDGVVRVLADKLFGEHVRVLSELCEARSDAKRRSARIENLPDLILGDRESNELVPNERPLVVFEERPPSSGGACFSLAQAEFRCLGVLARQEREDRVFRFELGTVVRSGLEEREGTGRVAYLR